MAQPIAGFDAFARERLIRALRRWGAVIAIGSLAAALAAFAISQSLERQYRSTAQLYLAPASTPTSASQDVVGGQLLARSYVQLAMTEVVLDAAAKAIGWERSSVEFRGRVQVAQVRDTSVITVSFDHPDPQVAADAANAIANSFISQSRLLLSQLQGSTQTQLDSQIRSIDEDIHALDAQVASLRAEIASTPRPGASPTSKSELQAQLAQLDSSRQSKQQTLAQLAKTRDDLALSVLRAQNTVTLWQPAEPSNQPVSPRIGLNVMLGFTAGALITMLLALAFSYIDDRLTDPEEVERLLGTPALGTVHLGERPKSLAGKLFLRDHPGSPEAEAFRSVRSGIQFAGVDRRIGTLLITSALPNEGKSVVSANLALAFAEAGTPTVLIDCDLRRPAQHRLFSISAAVGVTTLLSESGRLQDFSRFTVGPNLAVIPCGPLPPNPAQLLSSARMAALLEQLQSLKSDCVLVVDTSPILATADAVALSASADGCVMVVDSSRTRVAIVRSALQALSRVKAPVLGTILNKMSTQSGGYYSYYTGYSTRVARPDQRVVTRNP